MLKIVLKSFRYNISKYVLFFLGAVIAISQMFIFVALEQAISSGVENKEFIYAVFGIVYQYGPTFIVITIVILYYSLRSYIAKRIVDYKVFLLLGTRPSSIIKMLLVEYIIGFTLSFGFALLLGNLGFITIRYFINSFFDGLISSQIPELFVYKVVLVISISILLMVAYVSYLRLNKYVFENMILLDVKNQELPNKKKRLLFLCFGIIMMILSSLIYVSMGSNMSIILILISLLWVFGVMFVLYSLGAKFLIVIENRKSFFSKRMLNFTKFMEKYEGIIKVTTIVVLINFYALAFIAPMMTDYIPPKSPPYAYDAIVLQNSDQLPYYQELVNKYEGNLLQLQMFIMFVSGSSEVITISESSYVKLVDNIKSKEGFTLAKQVPYKVNLTDDEVLLIRQSKKSDGEYQKIKRRVYNNKYIDFLIGKYRGVDWVWDKSTEKMIFSIRDSSYHCFNLTGIKSIQGRDFAVISDKSFYDRYYKIKNTDDEPTILMLLNFPKSTSESALKEIKKHEAVHGVFVHRPRVEKYSYIMPEAFNDFNKLKTFLLIANGLFMISLMFSSAIIVVISIMDDESRMFNKYSILVRLGITNSDLDRLVCKDVRFIPFFAIIITLISTILNYFQWLSFLHRTSWSNNDPTGIKFLSILLVYLVIYLIITEIFVRYFNRRICKSLFTMN